MKLNCEAWCILTENHEDECQDMADVFWWNDGKHHETPVPM